MTKEHNCQLLLFCIQFLQWSLVSQTKAHGDESLHCKLWFAEKKKTRGTKKQNERFCRDLQKQNVFTEKVVTTFKSF